MRKVRVDCHFITGRMTEGAIVRPYVVKKGLPDHSVLMGAKVVGHELLLEFTDKTGGDLDTEVVMETGTDAVEQHLRKEAADWEKYCNKLLGINANYLDCNDKLKVALQAMIEVDQATKELDKEDTFPTLRGTSPTEAPIMDLSKLKSETMTEALEAMSRGTKEHGPYHHALELCRRVADNDMLGAGLREAARDALRAVGEAT